MLAPNIILQDRYRIVRLLGKGGMGAVYEAIDQRVSCLVALKEYTVGAQSEARQAFQREAALLANLRHSALPKVMDYFSDLQGDFLVMEFIPGHDLAELQALRGSPFPAEQVVRWAIELLKLLEYLHTRDPPILHRDIKPANLKVTKLDEVFLLDFGLAKGAAGQMATIETSRSVPGYTPVYAPIEQILGQGTDPRSDLYSLAATLYHLLTGQAPVSAPTRFDAVENDRPDPLPPANKLNSLVKPDIAAVVRSAMALSRKDRPTSAAEMRAALEQAVQAAAESNAVRDRAEADLLKTLPYPAEIDPSKPLVADKDVQFTIYTPQRIKPEKNYPVLAFAHLSKRRDDAADDEPDPIEQMKDEAARILGVQRDDYGDVKEASSRPVPRGGELSFVPVIEGITFSPPSRNFTWRKSVHREDFDMWAAREVDGQTLNGRMTVFLRSLIIAEIEMAITVDSQAVPAAEKIALDAAQSTRRLRQVFASYSPRDEQIVTELAQVAPIFGASYLTDRTHLVPGEDRREGLQRLIRSADVFQLFWSTNSMRSDEISSELSYAISLQRPGFILPTYWEEPVPRSPAEGLPPEEVDRLHFYRIYPGAISNAGSKSESRLVVMGPSGSEVYVDDERQGSIGRSGRLILRSISIGQHVLRILKAGERDDERVIEVHAGVEQVIQAHFAPGLSFSSSPSAASPGAARHDAPTGELSPGVAAMPRDTIADALPVGIVECTRCLARFAAGISVCGRCGGTTFAPVAMDASINKGPVSPVAASAPRQNYSAMAAPPDTLPVGAVKCTRCLASFAAGTRVCGRCGGTTFAPAIDAAINKGPVSPAPASAPTGNHPAMAAPRRKRSLMMPIFAGALMVLLVAILAPAWFMMSRYSSSPNLATAPTKNSNTSISSSNSANPVSTSPRSFTNAAGIEFVYIPAGKFMMGSMSEADDEKPNHTVTISKGFYMGKYEVTQKQWQVVMGNNPSEKKGENLPVANLSWDDAIKFVAQLNSRDTDHSYRLPTEAEWEYAARAGSSSTYPWGGEIQQACIYANVTDLKTKDRYPGWSVINCRDGYFDASPVGTFEPNSFGLYDMIGNVWEWCQDWYGPSYQGSASVDPQGPSSGTNRVLRGGSCIDVESFYRSAARYQSDSQHRSSNFGFRLVAVARTQ